jgi:hypothetical protein
MTTKGYTKMTRERDYYKESLLDSIEMCKLVISNRLILDAQMVEKARQEKYRFEFMLMEYNRFKEAKSNG